MTNSRSPYRYVRPEIIRRLASHDPFNAVEKQAPRYSYAEAILEVGKKYPNVVVLDADVSKSIDTNKFAERFPTRESDFGDAEQNMMAAVPGMATTGLIPVASTHAVFASMRALDQVRNGIHYPCLNVKIAASHGGITPRPDGVTHQGQEDLSLSRAIATSTVVAPANPVATKKAIWAAVEYDGPMYINFTRDPGAIVTAENNVISGGQGSAVAEVLVEHHRVSMRRIDVRDAFTESGPYLALLDRYGLSARHMADAVRQVVARKA